MFKYHTSTECDINIPTNDITKPTRIDLTLLTSNALFSFLFHGPISFSLTTVNRNKYGRIRFNMLLTAMLPPTKFVRLKIAGKTFAETSKIDSLSFSIKIKNKRFFDKGQANERVVDIERIF